MHKLLPKDAAWSKQFPSPVVANGHSRWHTPESAHQLRRPDCSKDIKLDISIRSFSRKPRKSSDKFITEWKVTKKKKQNIDKYWCPWFELYNTSCVYSVTEKILNCDRYNYMLREYICSQTSKKKLILCKFLYKTPWPQFTNEIYQQSDRCLLAKLLPTFKHRGCRVVSVTDPYGHILNCLGLTCCFFFQVAPQLYSRGWVDPVPDPLLLKISGRASGSIARNSDH
jgi:hypothetical protein